jgi:hypothetical protein
MKRKFRTAYNALEKIGCPVYEGGYNGEDTFRISGEDNVDHVWADYYRMSEEGGYLFGVSPRINSVLDKHGLFAEWCNAGVLNVWEV